MAWFIKGIMMRIIFKTLISLSAIFLWLSSLSALENGQQFKDWIVECYKLDSSTQNCGLVNHIYITKTKQLIAKVTLLNQVIDGKETLVMTVILPHNVYLPAQVALKVDQGKQYKISYYTCTKVGCEAQGFVRNPLIQAMKAGNQLHLGYVDVVTLQTILLPVSLSGITAGLNALGVQ
jgi:invasion protein IalB